MKPQWKAWIATFVAEHNGFVRGECKRATLAMVKAFPELRQTAGFAHWACPTRLVRDEHFWCVAPDGEIVDPTEAQFGGAPVSYEELDLDNPTDRAKVPSGRCMNCGEDVYGGNTFCDVRCENAARADMGLPLITE